MIPTEFDEAACRPWTGLHDGRGREPLRERRVWSRLAAAVCRSCPALPQCTDLADHYEQTGARVDGVIAARIPTYEHPDRGDDQ